MRARITSAAAATALALTLAACSGSEEPAATETTEAATETTTEATEAASTEANEADITFAQMMIIHHQGAIEMADLAATSAQSPEVRTLAEGIAAAQGPEIDRMTGWLEDWGAEVSPNPDEMGGMEHGGMDMGGLSQEEAMAELRSLSGADFDRRFLELMTEHHRGAIEMAEAELADGQHPEALDLAETIITDQEAEIAEMEQMLQAL